MTDADLDTDGIKALLERYNRWARGRTHDVNCAVEPRYGHLECALERAITTLLAEVEKLQSERGSALDREALGTLVRATWIEWAREQDSPPPHWLAEWATLAEPLKEVDRRIGEAIAAVCVSPDLLLAEQRITELEAAGSELLAVAALRGDDDLPHPAEDPKLWTARMQDAWDELDALINGPDMRTRAARATSEVK